MKRFRVRLRLFLASFALLLVVVVAGGVYLQYSLGSWFIGHIDTEMLRNARTARAVLLDTADVGTIEAVDPLADRLGAAASARVTVIAEDGRVLGDSELTPEEVRRVENHGDRPEVLDARRTGAGISHRYSETRRIDMAYVAVPFERSDGRGVVRIAMPLSERDALVARLRVLIVLGSLLAIAVALAASFLGSRYMAQTLLRLTGRARELTGGRPRAAGGLTGPLESIGALAEELELAVSSLASERDRIEAVLESLSDAVFALDDRQRVILVNRAAMWLLDLPKPPIGEPLSAFVDHPDMAERIAAARRGEAGGAEFDLPGETTRRVLARVAPQRTAGGMVVVLQDVTELRRLERIRRDFVANVSHELRTPISIIRANAETLLDGALEDPDRAREFLGAVLHHAERLSKLIADLLDISRIESGRYALEIRPTQVEPVARRIAEFVDAVAREKGIAVEVDVPPEVAVRADEKALEQVLLNLIDNAIKYTGAGGRVRVRATPFVTQVRVEVADDGPGISAEQRERLFERFYRIDPGRSRAMGGTGLGLAIVKHLVVAMGGRVGMRPNEPLGSVFWINLPLAAAPEAT